MAAHFDQILFDFDKFDKFDKKCHLVVFKKTLDQEKKQTGKLQLHLLLTFSKAVET